MNKVILITGGNAGIGKATAMGLAKTGATIIIGCRNREKGEAAVEEIKQASGNPNIELLQLDLASFKSVKAAAEEFKRRHNRLDVLINNAGVFLRNREVTEDGLEKTFQTNYLSHFLLTHLLLDELKAGAPARVINVASKHPNIKINFDDLQTTKGYSFMKAVGPTKLAMVIFAKEFAKRMEGSGVTAYSLHPGLAKSQLLDDISVLPRILFHLMSTSPEKCAETSIYLATQDGIEAENGGYFEKKKAVKAGSNATDEEINKRLWDVSMELAGLN
jgi:NAD(P)-dependent dehydrogenase (short-subunit alcohol dehydrogenase family)